MSAPNFNNPPNVINEHHHVPIIVNQENYYEEDHSKIPRMSTCCAVILLFVNIFLPGWGTVALMCFSNHHKCYFLLIGLLQFILISIIIGWVWAIITSVQVIKKSR